MSDTITTLVNKIKQSRQTDTRANHLTFQVSGDWLYSEGPSQLGCKIYLLTDPEQDDDCRIAIPTLQRLTAEERDGIVNAILAKLPPEACAVPYIPTSAKEVQAKSVVKFTENLPILNYKEFDKPDVLGYDLWIDTEWEQEKIKYVSSRMKLVHGTTNVVYGAPGSGKTTFLMALGMHYTQHREFMGLDVADGGKVLHLDWEMPELLSKNSFKRLRNGYNFEARPGSYTYFPKTILPFRLDDEHSEEILIELIRITGASLVIIDSLRRSIGADIDENDARIAQLVFDPLARVTDKTGATFVVIHHANKIGTTFRGSSSIEGEVSSLYRITQDKEKDLYTLSQEKSRAGRIMSDLCFNFIDMGEVIDDNFTTGLILARTEAPSEVSLDERILAALEGKTLSATELSLACGGSNNGQTAKVRDRLVASGAIIASASGKSKLYSLPAKEASPEVQVETISSNDFCEVD